MLELASKDAKNTCGVGYGLVPVFYGNFSLCKVRATNSQKTSTYVFDQVVLNLTAFWGGYYLQTINKELFVRAHPDHTLI